MRLILVSLAIVGILFVAPVASAGCSERAVLAQLAATQALIPDLLHDAPGAAWAYAEGTVGNTYVLAHCVIST